MGLVTAPVIAMKNTRPRPALQVVSRCCLLGLLLGLIAACDSNTPSRKSSSRGFFAPVPIAVDPKTGTNNQGESRIEVLANKLDMLRVIFPNALDSELAAIDASASVLGVVDGSHIIYESNSASIIEYNVQTDDLTLAVDRVQLSSIFFTPSPKFAALTELNDGEWIFGFETTQSSLFSMRKVLAGGIERIEIRVLANRRTIQQQLRKQQFNFVRSFEVGHSSFVNGGGQLVTMSEVLLIASPGGGVNRIDDMYLYIVTEVDGEISGVVRPFDENGTPYFGFTDGNPVDPQPVIPEINQIPVLDQDGDPIAFFGLVTYDQIRSVTGIFEVLVTDFAPRSLRDPAQPGVDLGMPPYFLTFDNASAVFLIQQVRRETSPTSPDFRQIIGCNVGLFTARGEVANAIRQGGGAGGAGGILVLRFNNSFFEPGETNLLAFEEESNSMMSLSFAGVDASYRVGFDPAFGSRAGVFSSAQEILQRRDVQGKPDADEAPTEPSLFFSLNDLSENRAMFDRGTDDIIAINYGTGQYVVVIKQADLGQATGSPGVTDLTYLDSITTQQIFALDTVSTTLLLMRVDYAFFPLRSGR